MTTVHLSGPVLASLCFEHANRNRDQEGLLLGQISNHVVDTISDSQITQSKQETIIYVMNYLPCDGLFSWYDHRGHVVPDKLRALLPANKHKEVIGWYKFRRNSTMCVSLRERAVHQHLKEAFPGIVFDHFLFCLFTSSTTTNLSTHSFDHNVLSFDGRKFNPLPVTVENLKDTTSHEHYKFRSASTNLPANCLFMSTTNDHRSMFLESTRGNDRRLKEVISIMTMNNQTQDKLMQLMEAVSVKELSLGKLKEEVKCLQERIALLKPKPTYTCSKPVPPPLETSPPEVPFIDIEMTINRAGAVVKKAKERAAAAAASRTAAAATISAATASMSAAAADTPTTSTPHQEIKHKPVVATQQAVNIHKRSKSDIRADVEMLSLDFDPQLTAKQNKSLGGGPPAQSSSQGHLPSAHLDEQLKSGVKSLPLNTAANKCLDKKNQVIPNTKSQEVEVEPSIRKNQEPFGFVDDLLVKAKSPTGSVPSPSYATLPRTGQASGRQTRSRSKETDHVETKSKNVNGQPAKTQTKVRAAGAVQAKSMEETLDLTLSSSPTF